jgi:hypothetical protein
LSSFDFIQQQIIIKLRINFSPQYIPIKNPDYYRDFNVTWLGLPSTVLRINFSPQYVPIKNPDNNRDFNVTWLGLEPRTPTLKVLCSTY